MSTEQLYNFETLANAYLGRQAYGELADLLAHIDLPRVPRADHLHVYFSGVLACERHDYAQADTLLRALLARQGVDSDLRARALNSLGVNTQYYGRYDQALDYYRGAQDAFAGLDDALGQAKALFNLGTAHRQLRQLDAAVLAFNQSLRLLDTLDARNWQTFALNGLGGAYTHQGQWQAAEETFRRMLAICQDMADREGTGIALNNLGELFLFTGRFEEAAAALDDALMYVETPLARLEIQFNRGLLCQACDELSAAASAYDGLFDLATSRHNVRYQALALYQLGNLQRTKGDDAAALHLYERALDLVETLRDQIERADVRIHLFNTWQQIYAAAILACVRLGHAAGALALAERARARALLDLLTGRDRGVHRVAPARPLTAQQIQERLPPDACALVYFCTGPGIAYRSIADALPAAGHALRAALWPPAAIVGFTVTPHTVHAQILDLEPDVLDQRALDSAECTLVGLTPGDNGQLLTPWLLRTLYEPLVAPLLNMAHAAPTDRPNSLVIVPHSLLHRVPFHALQDRRGRDLLAQGFDVAVAPSLSVWLRSRSTVTGGGGRVVIGYAPDLQHAQDEAHAVAGILGTRALTGPTASKANFLSAARDARVLHCSCHGTFSAQAPLQSALHLADGHLSAADLLQAGDLPLDLVFLSACESGRSHVEGGDELMGLVRAFLLAGTRTVIVSLWPVDELSTRILAELFYQAHVHEKQSAARALRHAQLVVRTLTETTMRARLAAYDMPPNAIDTTLTRLRVANQHWQQADPDRPLAHPYFWAGFMLVGV